MSANGLKVKKIVSNLAYPVSNTKNRARINNITFKSFEQFLAKQYFVLSIKDELK